MVTPGNRVPIMPPLEATAAASQRVCPDDQSLLRFPSLSPPAGLNYATVTDSALSGPIFPPQNPPTTMTRARTTV